MAEPIMCKQCRVREVEEQRRCYATPVCYTCLPPPKPLPRINVTSPPSGEHCAHCGKEVDTLTVRLANMNHRVNVFCSLGCEARFYAEPPAKAGK